MNIQLLSHVAAQYSKAVDLYKNASLLGAPNHGTDNSHQSTMAILAVQLQILDEIECLSYQARTYYVALANISVVYI